MTSPTVGVGVSTVSYLCFLNRLLRRIIWFRRSYFLFRCRCFLSQLRHSVEPPAYSFVLRFLGLCGAYDVASMIRAETKLRRMLWKLKMRSSKRLGISSGANSRIKKYLLRRRLRSFTLYQRRNKFVSRLASPSNVVRETYSVRQIDYRSFLADNSVQPLDADASCSGRARVVPVLPSEVRLPDISLLERSAFHSYFSKEPETGLDSSQIVGNSICDAEVGVTSSLRWPRPLNHLLDEYADLG